MDKNRIPLSEFFAIPKYSQRNHEGLCVRSYSRRFALALYTYTGGVPKYAELFVDAQALDVQLSSEIRKRHMILTSSYAG